MSEGHDDVRGEHAHPEVKNGRPQPDVEALVQLVMAQSQRPHSMKWQLITGVRQLVVAVMTSAIIVGGLIVGFAGQTAREAQLARDTLHANLAQACVLTLPSDPETGRDPGAVQLCFTQYGLQAPKVQNSPGE